MAKVPVVIRGKELGHAEDSDVDYSFDSPDAFLGSHASTIPLTNTVAAPRSFYGARFVNQAQAAVNREHPWVQRKMDGTDKSFDDKYGPAVGALHSEHAGEVIKVGKNHIHIATPDGVQKVELAVAVPYNRKSSITHYPKVKVGDKVTKGQLLADSSFTKDGALALGINARIALVPHKGNSIDDAIVASEDFAKRMATEHTYGFSQDYDDNVKMGKAHFAALFPKKYTQEQLDKLDENGMAKPGARLNPGDPILLATKPKPISSRANLSGLSRGYREMRTDASQVWDDTAQGTVSDSLHHKGTSQVYVSAIKGLSVGDKIVGRAGSKAIVSKILPSDKMLRGKDGRPMDLLLNPLSLYSRVNVNTPYSMWLGKIAEKRGEPYKLEGFNPHGTSVLDFVKSESKKHGVDPMEEVFDPESGLHLENPVFVGNDYILRLHHLADSKRSERGVGSYSQDEQPSRGGGDNAQAKRLSGLETASLLSSGAYATLREGSTIRGAKNDSFWRALRSGHTIPNPETPFVWHKYRALLAGAGLRTKDTGNGGLRLGAYTDKDLEKEKPVEIQNADTIDMHALAPVKGGLFDPVMAETKRWGKISLPYPVPHPAFTGAICKTLGLTRTQLREVMAGRMKLSDAQR